MSMSSFLCKYSCHIAHIGGLWGSLKSLKWVPFVCDQVWSVCLIMNCWKAKGLLTAPLSLYFQGLWYCLNSWLWQPYPDFRYANRCYHGNGTQSTVFVCIRFWGKLLKSERHLLVNAMSVCSCSDSDNANLLRNMKFVSYIYPSLSALIVSESRQLAS